jgi:hypothetical protein
VKSAKKQLGAGGAGSRASVTGPPSRAKNSGGSKAGAIASVCASVKLRQLLKISRARASAQRRRVRILRRGRALGPVATKFFPSLQKLRTGVFAVWRAAWRYVACWIGKRVIERVVGGNVGPG